MMTTHQNEVRIYNSDLSVAGSLDQVVQSADCRKPGQALWVVIVMYSIIAYGDDYDDNDDDVDVDDDDDDEVPEDTCRSSNKSSCSAANKSLPMKLLYKKQQQ